MVHRWNQRTKKQSQKEGKDLDTIWINIKLDYIENWKAEVQVNAQWHQDTNYMWESSWLQLRIKKALQPSVLSYRYQGGQSPARTYRWWGACWWFCRLFMGKIRTLWDSLGDHPRYNPHGPAKASLNQFTSVSPEDVVCIIWGMPTKSCESDVIPSSLLKEILTYL